MTNSTTTRPKIPADIRRHVLLEAGHRCAIHTCRHTQVEIHHIIPWAQCKRHEFENLIALCPNCHGLAGSGIIDRKSLREYKRKLQQKIGLETLPSGSLKCETVYIEEELSQYKVELAVPYITPVTAEILQVNSLITTHILSELHDMRSSEASKQLKTLDWKMQLNYDYDISFLNNDLISIKINRLHDASMHGAAHPNHDATTLNLNLKPAFLLSLANIFDEQTNYLDFLSKFAREELYARFSVAEEAVPAVANNFFEYPCAFVRKQIQSGTEPNEKCFSKFRLTKSSIIFTFNEYEVADYCSGEQEIEIPFGALEEYISPKSAIHKAYRKSERKKAKSV